MRHLLLPALLSAMLVACGEDRPVDPGPDPDPPLSRPTAPTDVYVLPGPETDGVTVIPQGVTGASSYVFYRSTESGFTVGPGTMLGSNNQGGWVDRPLAAGTYYYRVTAYNDAGEGPPSAETSIVFAPGFAVEVTAPGVNGLGADDLRVALTIVSDLELAEVTADVGGHGAVLAFAGETGAWEGMIDLHEVARGAQRLAFSITDAAGSHGSDLGAVLPRQPAGPGDRRTSELRNGRGRICTSRRPASTMATASRSRSIWSTLPSCPSTGCSPGRARRSTSTCPSSTTPRGSVWPGSASSRPTTWGRRIPSIGSPEATCPPPRSRWSPPCRGGCSTWTPTGSSTWIRPPPIPRPCVFGTARAGTRSL